MNISSSGKAIVFDLKKMERRKNTISATIGTYEGKDQNGDPKYSNWRAYFVGEAYKKAFDLHEKDKIILSDAKIENNYDYENEVQYVYVTIFNFKPDEDEESGIEEETTSECKEESI